MTRYDLYTQVGEKFVIGSNIDNCKELIAFKKHFDLHYASAKERLKKDIYRNMRDTSQRRDNE